MNLPPEHQTSVLASPLDHVLHIEKSDMDRRAMCAFNFAMKSPEEEWRTYGFISELLFMFALAMSTPTTTISLVPQFNLIPNKAIPDFGAYVQRVDVSPSMGLVWEAKPLSGLDYQDLGLSVSEFWKRATVSAEASLTSYYDSIEAYAEKSFRESSPPVIPGQHIFIAFSSGPVFSVFEFTRNQYFKKWTLDPQYAKDVPPERRRLAPKVHYLFQPMFTISDDRSRVTWSPQILAAMHLPYKDLNLSSKVPWFHPVTPMETGADEGLQFVMKYTAQKFKEDIENYLEGEKTHVTSDQANESEYVPKHALPRRPQPKRPPHGTVTATVSDSVTVTTTTAASETVQSLAPAVVASMTSDSTIHFNAPSPVHSESSPRVHFKTTPPTSRGSAGGAASTELNHLPVMGAVVDTGQLPQDARPPVRQKRKGRVSDPRAAAEEANAPKKRPKASSATGELKASAASVPGHAMLGDFLVMLESTRKSVSVSGPTSTPPTSHPPPLADDTVHAPAPSATPQAVLSTASTTVTVSGSDTPAVADAPTPDVSQSHPSVSEPQADHLPVAHEQSPEPEGTAPSEAVDRDSCDLDAGTLADLEGSDTDNATGTSSRGRRKTVHSITWIDRPDDLIADLPPLPLLESETDPDLQKNPGSRRLGGPETRQVTKEHQTATSQQHANSIATLPKPHVALQLRQATKSESNDSRNKRRQPRAGPSGERREHGSKRAVEGDEDEDGEDEDEGDEDEGDEDEGDEDLDDDDDEDKEDDDEDDDDEDSDYQDESSGDEEDSD